MTTRNEQLDEFHNNKNVAQNPVEALQMAYLPIVVNTLKKIVIDPDNAQQTYNEGIQKIFAIGKDTGNKDALRQSLKSYVSDKTFDAELDVQKFPKEDSGEYDIFWIGNQYINLIQDTQKVYVREGIFTWKDFNPLSSSASPSSSAYDGVNTNGQTLEEEKEMRDTWKAKGYVSSVPQ